MNHQEIEQTAKFIEHEAEHGHTNTLAYELHMMSSENREAIAQQIKADQNKQPAELPKLEFYGSGELKSYDKKDKVYQEHTEYDENTNARKSTHIERWDGNKEDHKFDPKTNIETQRTLEHPDHTSVTDDFNPKNGYFKEETVHNKDGSSDRYFDDSKGELIHVKKDALGHVTETEGSDHKTRKFHYDSNGNLDQIDGHLGHWERGADKNGNEQWTNKDNKKVWDGSFQVDTDGNLHFRPQHGQGWVFTNDGRDLKSK